MAERNEYHCDRCNKDFNSEEQLETHNREQHGIQAGSPQSREMRDVPERSSENRGNR